MIINIMGLKLLTYMIYFEKRIFEKPLTLKPFEQSFIDNFLKIVEKEEIIYHNK